MKIKNIAAICKKNKYAVIYERYTEGGGVVQYIGDGAAAYPVTGLPELDKESLLTIFDVPEKQREDWFVQVAGILRKSASRIWTRTKSPSSGKQFRSPIPEEP